MNSRESPLPDEAVAWAAVADPRTGVSGVSVGLGGSLWVIQISCEVMQSTEIFIWSIRARTESTSMKCWRWDELMRFRVLLSLNKITSLDRWVGQQESLMLPLFCWQSLGSLRGFRGGNLRYQNSTQLQKLYWWFLRLGHTREVGGEFFWGWRSRRFFKVEWCQKFQAFEVLLQLSVARAVEFLEGKVPFPSNINKKCLFFPVLQLFWMWICSGFCGWSRRIKNRSH